ncbi:hypothetical protein [Aquisediminimonas profunda]|uniref:hypothetical protein n=1 Tax=Aquisediminimonas profunda TaxID=1550733 RepID=UPI001C628968|nr:hypothetical protein [Aquisediminimonas profunda]
MGQVVTGKDLAAYVETCWRNACLFIADKFYSHLIYEPDGSAAHAPISAAAHVWDVDTDPVRIVDGPTRN